MPKGIRNDGDVFDIRVTVFDQHDVPNTDENIIKGGNTAVCLANIKAHLQAIRATGFVTTAGNGCILAFPVDSITAIQFKLVDPK